MLKYQPQVQYSRSVFMKKITLATMFYLLFINCHWAHTLIGAIDRATLQMMVGESHYQLVLGVEKGAQFNSKQKHPKEQ